jgi:DNA-directed RNA polymerase specialized sigma24 family protein
MEQLQNVTFLDEDGNPVDERIAETLRRLESKFRRQFPNIQDDVAATLVGEAASKVARHVRLFGPLEKPFGFAWKVLKNLGVSALRGRSIELHLQRAVGKDGDDLVATLRAFDHSAGQIEDHLFMREAEQHLTQVQRRVWVLKCLGHTSEEAASLLGCSAGAVDVAFSRAKKKIRELAGIPE